MIDGLRVSKRTIGKEIGIGAIYFAVSFVAFVLTAYWVCLYA